MVSIPALSFCSSSSIRRNTMPIICANIAAEIGAVPNVSIRRFLCKHGMTSAMQKSHDWSPFPGTKAKKQSREVLIAYGCTYENQKKMFCYECWITHKSPPALIERGDFLESYCQTKARCFLCRNRADCLHFMIRKGQGKGKDRTVWAGICNNCSLFLSSMHVIAIQVLFLAGGFITPKKHAIRFHYLTKGEHREGPGLSGYGQTKLNRRSHVGLGKLLSSSSAQQEAW